MSSGPGPHVTFVPGAAGSGAFWTPVAEKLPAGWTSTALDLPGLGATPPDAAVTDWDALVRYVGARIERPGVLVGQSMGGYLALAVALSQPDLVTHLVVTVAAGGLDMAALGATDWRPGYAVEYPTAALWATAPVPDLSGQLAALTMPTLLVWATRDAISPLAVAERLAALLPAATLVTFDTDDHWVARQQAAAVAAAVVHHVSGGSA